MKPSATTCLSILAAEFAFAVEVGCAREGTSAYGLLQLWLCDVCLIDTQQDVSQMSDSRL